MPGWGVRISHPRWRTVLKILAAAIPGARLRILPDVGHLVPPRFWPEILDDLCDLLDSTERTFDTMV